MLKTALKPIHWFLRLPLKNKIILSGLLNLIGFNFIILLIVQDLFYQQVICTLNICVWIITLIIAVVHHNINIPYRIMTIYGLISIGLGATVNGGMYSSYIFWLPIISLGMSIFSDRTLALSCLVFSIIAYTIFTILQWLHIVDFHEQLQKVPILLDFANFSSCIVMLGIIHYFFLTKERINFMWEKVNEKKVEALEYKLSQKELEIQKMRNDMAKDFHDEMGNKLASISILSQTLAVKLSNSSIALDLEKIKTLETIELRAQEMYQGTKDFIWSVDYKSDFVLELFIYLREFGESFFNQIDIDFKSEYKLDEDIPYRLETLMGRHCILICKEVMTNAAKYAQCSDFVFEMSTDQSTLCMLLSDNGCGFDLNTVVKRGIENINHRCSFIKAQLSIHSGESGTSYHIKIPLFAI